STPEQTAQMKEIYADLEKNVKVVAFGARFDKEGHARLLTRVCLQPDGPYAKWIAKASTVDGQLLKRFPEHAYVAAALVEISSQANFKGWVRRLYSEKLPPDKKKELTAGAVALLHRVSQVGVSVYLDAPAKSSAKETKGDVSVAGLAKVDNAAT